MKGKIQSLVMAAIIMLCSCHSESTTVEGEIVKYDGTARDFISTNLIKSIEILPIKRSLGITSLGMNTKLIPYGNGYLIADPMGSKTIIRLDSSAIIINTIGHVGRGANEYLTIDDIDVNSQNSICVYSANSKKINVYNNTGKCLSSQKTEYQFYKACDDRDNSWLHLGVNNPYFSERIVKIDSTGTLLNKLLAIDSKIMQNQELNSVFSKNKNDIYFREMFDNNIYRITENNVLPIYSFDFGQYNIPEQYYKMDTPIEAAKYLLNQEFATLRNFVDNDNYSIVEVFIQKQTHPTLSYGIKDKSTGKWQWVNYSIPNDLNDLFAGRTKYLTNNSEVILLVEPETFLQDKKYNSLYKNVEALELINDDIVGVILKCQL